MQSPAPAVQRTIQIIELLLQNPDGLTPQELLSRVDTSRSTLFAMLRTLKALGYVEQSRERGRYQAGARLVAWRKTEIASPGELLSAFYHEAGRAGLQETLALFQAAGGAALLLAQVESPLQVRSVYAPDQIYPPEESAPARLLLMPDESTRAQGYALHASTDHIEIAVPVCRDGTHPVAALVLSAPRHRLEDAAR
ncbi:MAG: winged helix-turn-helix transcriptional regulator, partial [Anaerolineae bacterium]